MEVLLRIALCALLLLPALSAAPPASSGDSLVDLLSAELRRNFDVLGKNSELPAYFVSYSMVDTSSEVLSASLGALTANRSSRNRQIDVSVRVGDRKFDNYHRARSERGRFSNQSPVPFDEAPEAIQRRLWSVTDRAYRGASERLIRLKSNREVRVAEEDDSDDFSVEKPSVEILPAPVASFPRDAWMARVRTLSARFRKYPEVLYSSVTVLYQVETKRFVSTEGSRLRHGRIFARVMIGAQGKGQDGADLQTSETFEAAGANGLPDDARILAAIDAAAGKLIRLLKAPEAEPFVGPAILSGKAAGVFFHEIFGHRIEGHRQKDESEGQTFTKSVGGPVLPDFLSVVFDATRPKMGGVDLNGTYAYDDEGMPARPVTLVDKGVLKTFLLSRSPIKGFPQSNGHGRRQPGLEVVSRQSNLIVESTKAVSDSKLREMLLAEVKRQNKPYGIYFEDITGGFTTTGRGGLQAFKVIPLVVYRVYADGRPDEIIRGADIVGTPLASFSRILATGDKASVFNGYCGAESGSVPVSAVSPALLISEIEIERKAKSEEKLPILPAPDAKEQTK